jgi:hypothetical protein
MPGDDRLRFDNDESRAPFGPEAEEPDPEESVPGSKFGPAGNGTSQDDDLVSQGEDSVWSARRVQKLARTVEINDIWMLRMNREDISSTPQAQCFQLRWNF